MKQPHTKNTQILIDGGKFICIALTHNWAGDGFRSAGDTPQQAIRRTITNVAKDGKETWLISELNKLLKKYAERNDH